MREDITTSTSPLLKWRSWYSSKDGQRLLVPIVFLFPSLLIYAVFVIGTMIYSLVLSFTNWDGISRTFNFIGLVNYFKLFNDAQFYNAIKNNLIWVVISLLLPMFLGLL